MELSAQTFTIIIGVITLLIGVINSIISNRRTVQSQHIQVILVVSESFRQRWENGWSDILDELNVDHLTPRREPLPKNKLKDIRFMLNWIDWLGTMKASGALNQLDILTLSIEAPIRRIINAGYTLIENDINAYGNKYWGSLFVVANDLKIDSLSKIMKSD